MRIIGLIGGMSWESTVTYYQVLNRMAAEKLGGLHSARCLLASVDFGEIEAFQAQGRWDEIARVLGDAAAGLQKAGADAVALCTNTMHNVAPQIESRISVPFLHIADATADELLRAGLRKVGLLGTAFTMEQNFYKERLRARGLEALTPDAADRQRVSAVIYDELCLGKIVPESKAFYLSVIGKLAAGGAEAVILGCTEIGLLVQQNDTPVRLFDTAYIHARSLALYALGEADK